MDYSKINQSQLKYSCDAGEASVNLYTGRILFEHPDISIGANSFQIGITHIYNSQIELPINIDSCMGNGWKLNVQQYVFPYNHNNYPIEGFAEGDYVYIDGPGFIHKFVWYKEITDDDGHIKGVYYDTSGSGLVLSVDSLNAVCKIIDATKNIIEFNSDGSVNNIKSGINEGIIKEFEYTNDKLSSICDTRKSNRKIEFYYTNDGLLEKIKCSESDITIKYFYKNGYLTSIKKCISNESKDIAYFYYSYNNGKLEYAVDAEDKSALKFFYEPYIVEGNYRISRINTGTVFFQSEYGQPQPALFCGDDYFCGDDIFCGESYKPVIGKKVSMGPIISPYCKTSNKFDYNANVSTSVTNEKGITIVYFFNNNGFTTGILEDVGNENYRTLSKTSGWGLWEGDEIEDNEYTVGTIAFNKKRVTTILNNASYIVPSDKFNKFKNIFGYNSNLTPKKHEYTDNFVVSFWVRLNGTGNINKAKLSYQSSYCKYLDWYGNLIHFENNYFSNLDNVPNNSWQYITIPIRFDENQEDNSFITNDFHINQVKKYMSNMRLMFEGDYTGNILIADLRIAPGNWTDLIIDKVDLKNIEYIGYTVGNNTARYKVGSDFFMTESDVFATYRNLYHRQESTKFDLVYCSGTKIMSVPNVIFHEKDNATYHFFSIENGIPNYYSQSKNRVAKKSWCVTELQMCFKNHYYEQKTTVDFIDSFNNRPDPSKASNTYIWTNADGTPRATKDAYNVITHNYYDDYGNLTSIKTYNEANQNPEDETLITEYKYERFGVEVIDKFREQPLWCEKDGVRRHYDYNEPWMTPNFSVHGYNQLEWSYDDYHDKLMEMKHNYLGTNIISAKNIFAYDYDGRLKCVTDQSDRIYGFQYNIFGEPIKFYENGNLLLEKTIERNENYSVPKGENGQNLYNADKITEKRFRSNNDIDITKTIIDKYGRVQTQNNDNNTITYHYQDDGNPYDPINDAIRYNAFSFTESVSVAKVTQIYDPYEKQTYNYHYDEENRSCGYSTSGGDGTGAKQFDINQITTSDTQYHFYSDDIMRTSTVITEDSEVKSGNNKIYIEPRIHRTKDTDKGIDDPNRGFNDTEKEFEYMYQYDHLGRLKETTGAEINYKFKLNLFNRDAYMTPGTIRVYKPNTSLITSLEHVVSYYTEPLGQIPMPVKGSSSIIQSYGYDERGNLETVIETGEGFVDVPEPNMGKVQLNKSIKYEYDVQNRLTREYYSLLSKDYTYEYESNSDKLKTVKLNGSIIKSFSYTGGRRTSYIVNGNISSIYYDNYGNVITHLANLIRWNSRNLLHKYGSNIEYLYNNQGVRFKKKLHSGVNKDYFLDGSRILGEDWSDSTGVTHKIRYFYNAEGIAGLRYQSYNFNFIRDGLGNVSKVMHRGKLIAEYNYDAWGNCSIQYLGTMTERDSFIVENNPFRWKGHYCDLETGLYYIDGRYYSSEIMQYLDADTPENLLTNAFILNALDRNAITIDNPISFLANDNNIFPSVELYPDPHYDPNYGKSWWDLHWKKAVQWIAFGAVLLVSVVLMCLPFPGAQAFGIGMFTAGIKGAISGFIIGGVIGGLVSAKHGNSFLAGFLEGSIYGLINGFTTAALLFCASQAVGAIKAANARKPCRTSCFIAGTLVLTEEGNKAIEDIEVGDMVWAYNEETNQKDLKKVVRLFRNETYEWVHIDVYKTNEETCEEIVCTPEHPFYIPDIGWVNASNLVENMEVLLYNGTRVKITKVAREVLETPATTYNFEVEDYHTYYVSESSVLVHNTCAEVKKLFKEFGVDNFDDLAAKYTPDEMIGKLDNMGYSKSISMKNPNSPATVMSSPNGKLNFRIQTINPQGGTAYFRAFNAGGGALNSAGIFPSWASAQEMRLLTHFYFGG